MYLCILPSLPMTPHQASSMAPLLCALNKTKLIECFLIHPCKAKRFRIPSKLGLVLLVYFCFEFFFRYYLLFVICCLIFCHIMESSLEYPNFCTNNAILLFNHRMLNCWCILMIYLQSLAWWNSLFYVFVLHKNPI